MRPRSMPWRGAAVLAALALAACGGTADTAADAAADTEPAATAESPATTDGAAAPAPDASSPATQVPGADVPAALAFRAPTVGGGELDVAGYAGMPVAFWFWAPY